MARKGIVVFTVVVLMLALGLGAADAPPPEEAITVRAVARGESEPPVMDPEPGSGRKPSVRNGDFIITSNAPDQRVGDGVDEYIIWTMDFRKDPNYPFFINSKAPITNAIITLEIRRMATHDEHQAVYIQETACGFTRLHRFTPPCYCTYPKGEWVTITYDLMGRYRPQELLDAFNRLDKGTYPEGNIFALLSDTMKGDIPMIFRDDAFIRKVTMELTRGGSPAAE